MLLSLASRTVTFGSVAKTLKNAGSFTRLRVYLMACHDNIQSEELLLYPMCDGYALWSIHQHG